MNNTINPNALLAQMRALTSQAQGVPAQTPVEKKADFSDLLQKSIDKVNETQQQASSLQVAFQKGDKDIQLAEVMVAMQKANVSFQAMLEVRNKLVGAYQEIMNMQI